MNTSMRWLTRLHRLEHAGLPVYVDQARPDWFVPSSRTDQLLRACRQHNDQAAAVADFCCQAQEEPDRVWRDLRRLQHLLYREEPAPYLGRAHYLRPGPLKEIWFHLTDTCNLACRHCLFSSSPAQKNALEPQQLYAAIDQAAALGSRLFSFTGGEPFVYPDFCRIMQYILEQNPAHHVAVLTNGLLLQEQMHELLRLDTERLHLQVSLDGPEKEHDALRGQGSYRKLCENLQAAAQEGLQFTVSVAVNRENISRLEETARQAHALGAGGLHLLYHFIRGKGTAEQFVPVLRLFTGILRTAEVCRELSLQMDNLEAMKAQVFAVPGTRFDLSNMGWESLAVGPDGKIYPSPALIGSEELVCGSLEQGLDEVWQNNVTLKNIRSASLKDVQGWDQRPLSLITGGGDPDHSWTTGHSLTGHDPYLALYEQLALQLLVEQATQSPDQGLFRLRMGDVRHDCPDTENGSDGSVGLTHCNCLLSLADHDGHASVREFYSAAARSANEEIINPFAPAADTAHYIPEEAKQKSYGCGSPVKDAAPQNGETVVDLGSGSGVECFLAAAAVGPTGRVYGIDMTDAMLDLARKSKRDVVKDLGFDNIEFHKGYLEEIPLNDAAADVVISNCVINLSPDKRRTYLEILRVLKPGGRLVVADVVTDGPVSAAVRNSRRYRGECLGGAMQQDDLIVMLEDCGFSSVFLHKRAPYRELDGSRFYSLTYEAGKAAVIDDYEKKQPVRCIYRGPSPILETASGERLERGRTVELPAEIAAALGDQIFVLDDAGTVLNVEQDSCCCAAPETKPQEKKVSAPPIAPLIPVNLLSRHLSDCMVCGGELEYLSDREEEKSCHFCDCSRMTGCFCVNGHFICDACHQQGGIDVIRNICLNSEEKDLLGLFSLIRSHPAVPMHGPEHHSMVPGIILTAYRNNGGRISRDVVATGIDRGSNVPGGACGFWGTCGAAVGAGIAASLILEGTPLAPDARQKSLVFTARIMTEIARINGARCCQREAWLALTQVARLSGEFFGIELPANRAVRCSQYQTNRECIRMHCPLWETRDWAESGRR